ncbi:DNA topoisomerase 4 subunit A [bacterium]|nr:DNA topoisomerase 4 subunit A [bacterium]
MIEQIETVNIKEEAERRYLNYALSVVTSRALPDVRDGLKPVQRRILFAMRQEGYRADGRTRKCVGVTGEVTKSYHPHGDDPVYEALVRMAQDFVMRYPLIHGEGNFGSVDGDPPAARRYTECKLLPIAEELMTEIDQNTVDFRPNFDGEKTEPVVLPAQFPQLLANGSQGIAVGMATNIPPHNIGELIKACLILIDEPEATTAQLVNLQRGPIRGPDFPLGGRMLIDQPTLRQIYETGQGSIRVQGEWKLEEDKIKGKSSTNGKTGSLKRIIISSIPHGVNKGNMLAAMGEIIAQRKLPMVENLVDESSLANGMRIVVEIRADSDPNAVMAYFFKHTQLQDNFNCNFTSLFPANPDGPQGDVRPRRTGIKEMLAEFLTFRTNTVRRRFEYILEQLRRRIHILEGFEIIFNALDEAIRIIRQSDGRSDSAERLRKRFSLTEIQSFAIVDLNLYRIGKLEIEKIRKELAEKRAEAERIERILASPKRLRNEVRGELEAFGEKYGGGRKTRLADEEAQPEFDPEAYIVRENTNVVLTREGWVKRVGRISSVASTRTREGDEVLAVLPGSTLDFIVLFSSDGVAYTIRIDELPVSSGYGEPLAKFFRMGDGASIVGAITTDPRFTPAGRLSPTKKIPYFPGTKEWQVLVATSGGNVLRTPLTPFLTPSTKAGRRYVRLEAKDEVVLVAIPTEKDESIFLASDDGHLIHFPIDQVIELSGVGKGVHGIKLEKNARCLGGCIIGDDNELLRLENTNGTEIPCRGGKYKSTSRGGKGVEIIKRGGLRRIIPNEPSVIDWNDVPESRT